MPQTKEKQNCTVPVDGIHEVEVREITDIPWRNFLYAWECIDWELVRQFIFHHSAVFIDGIEPDEEEHWFAAAYKNIGKQNVSVFYDSTNSRTGKLWIIPRDSVPGTGVDVIGPRITAHELHAI